jgi:hypothetical protein
MTYVPGMKTDVFVSYPHASEGLAVGEELPADSWTATFRHRLETSIRNRLGGGRQVDVWLDPRLRTGHAVWPEIESTIRGAATFVVLYSPLWRDSSWCIRERDLFLSRLDGRLEPERLHQAGYFEAVRYPDGDGERTARRFEIKEIVFHSKASDIPVELKPGTDEFERKIAALANDMKDILRLQRNQRRKVFLAGAADGMRERLFNGLVDEGYNVVPHGALSEFTDKRTLEEEMSGATHSIHLFEKPYDDFAFEQLRRACDLKIRPLIGISKGLDDLYTRVIRNPRPEDELGSDLAWWELGSENGFLADLKAELAKAPVKEAAEPGRPVLYLIYDECTAKDADQASKLADMIRREEDVAVLVPGSGAREMRHRESLQSCNGALLYADSAPRSWLYQSISSLNKAGAEVRRKRPIQKGLATSIDLGPLQPFEHAPLDAGQLPNPAALRRFIQRVRDVA